MIDCKHIYLSFFLTCLFCINSYCQDKAGRVIEENTINQKGDNNKVVLKDGDIVILKTHKNCGDCFREISNFVLAINKKSRIYFIEFIDESSDPVWYISENKQLVPKAKKYLFIPFSPGTTEVNVFYSTTIQLQEISPVLLYYKSGKVHLYSYSDMYDINGIKDSFKSGFRKLF